jgi:hypothetical protein
MAGSPNCTMNVGGGQLKAHVMLQKENPAPMGFRRGAVVNALALEQASGPKICAYCRGAVNRHKG